VPGNGADLENRLKHISIKDRPLASILTPKDHSIDLGKLTIVQIAALAQFGAQILRAVERTRDVVAK
jgi:hypothetical protein